MPDNYLVVRLGSFGDVLLTTGVLSSWNTNMDCRFHVVTRSSYSDIFLHHPGVEKVIPVNAENLTPRGWYNFCAELKRNYSSWDLIDLHVNLRTFFLKRVWPRKTHSYPKMGLCRRLYAGTGWSYFKNKLLENNVPQRYHAALRAGHKKQSDLTPQLFLEPAEISQALEKMTHAGLNRQTICIHPYATHQAKTWPGEKWKQLCSLLEKNDYNWIIIGQHDSALYPLEARDFTNQTSIRETAAIISHCQALVTGDSGPMHLASAVNTPVIGLFGPTSREWGFYPSGPEDIIIESDLACRPCSLHGKATGKCRIKCMKQLEPQQIINALNNSH